MSFVNGEEEFDLNLVESAKSSLIFELVGTNLSTSSIFGYFYFLTMWTVDIFLTCTPDYPLTCWSFLTCLPAGLLTCSFLMPACSNSADNLCSLLWITVKASNFVILLGENIFFHKTFFRLPHDIFWYWNLYSNGLGIGQSHFGLGHCLGIENSFFQRVTNLGDRLLISSPSEVFKVTMKGVNKGCLCCYCFCDRKNL